MIVTGNNDKRDNEGLQVFVDRITLINIKIIFGQ
jgi:hypothetical protein